MSGCLLSPGKRNRQLPTMSESSYANGNNSVVEESVTDTSEKPRIFGPYTRHLLEIFERYAKDGKLSLCNVVSAFHDLNLYPSHSQVHQMVHCAVEYGSPCVANNITFGEFCVLVEELQHHYIKNQPLPCPSSAVKLKCDGTESRRKRKESQSNSQVFLGGSCNPTTWRHDIAIPFLKKRVITFYNPVNTWRPELIELEDKAKQAADLLCFVIDNQTRAVVSMIETSYLVGCYRQIIFVMKQYDIDEDIIIKGETVTDAEKSDLIRVRNVLIDIVERNSIPVFTDINDALQCVVYCVHQGIPVQDLEKHHGANPVKHGHFETGHALLKLRETFNSITCDNEKMSRKDVQLAYKCITGEVLPSNWIQSHSRVSSFTFEDLCCLVTECKKRRPSYTSSFLSRLISPFTSFINKFRSRPPPPPVFDDGECRDVYLGGSYGVSTWRKNMAIPLLRRNGLSYLNPIVNEWSYNLIPMQVAAREKCRLLLYVFTRDTRSFAAMVEAGYYIGRGCRVVLCIQYITKDAVIAGEKLSESALEDYNRGRMYLSDMASKEGIQIFDDISDSINCAISLLKEIKEPKEI
ncbi:uncharacterized protein LOC126826475 isoform X2 [Patella vulgata]|uniref:uncharacterized protein LOC126826475 isoform X2 n=1 Tax=Patella vulgata TaxID=6465 RepID=UPI00217F4E6F|nr:uncharacterized protein LOC126826475 isoform X2 [Patella vulgata]